MRAARWLLPMIVSLVVAAAVLVATGTIDVRVGFRDNLAQAAGLVEDEAAAKATPAGPFWRDGSGAAPSAAPRGAPSSFADLTERVAPAVVSIQAERTQPPPDERTRPRNPIEELFGFPFGGGGVPRAGEGSGFVISADGYIVTNNHVVAPFDKIDVVFLDGTTLPARVIGRDSATDVALLKVESTKSLQSLSLGDSDGTRIGDWVVAIGNPLGLENTVTAGIVSAKHRRTLGGDGPRYSDFIQTDAAINPGNSGGPLVNLAGEVVGINTMIASDRNIGIGFAIPVNMAKQVLPQLRAKGRVSRGKLGVGIQPVDADAAEFLGLASAGGALVQSVEEGSPAERAGIKQGDVIVEFNGKAIKEMDELPQLVAATPVGARSKVVLVRKGKRQTVDVTIGALALEEDAAALPGGEESEATGAYGLSVQTLTPQVAAELRLDESVKGVVVTRVRPGSPAETARLQAYDVILEVNQAPVASSAVFKSAIDKNPKGALLLVRRGRQEIFVTMKRAGK
ncbi:MAG TPA: Do family serine endopeptidase [Myxococcota bacterium]|jgi:serine protease Do